MKLILFLALALYNNIDCTQLQSVRESYHTIQTEDQLNMFIEYLKKMDCEMAHPYLASATMQKAQYCFWPTEKLRYFNEGKNMLEDFIQTHPENIEARYVRLLVQSELPAFLGYKDEIKTDSAFIKEHIGDSDLPIKYQDLMLKNIGSILKK